MPGTATLIRSTKHACRWTTQLPFHLRTLRCFASRSMWRCSP